MRNFVSRAFRELNERNFWIKKEVAKFQANSVFSSVNDDMGYMICEVSKLKYSRIPFPCFVQNQYYGTTID